MTPESLAETLIERNGSLTGALREALKWHDFWAWSPGRAALYREVLWHLASNAERWI